MPSSLSRYRHYGNTHGKSKTLTSGDLTSFMYQVARGMDFLTSRGVSAIVVVKLLLTLLLRPASPLFPCMSLDGQKITRDGKVEY